MTSFFVRILFLSVAFVEIATAQDVIPIRAGEHTSFSRLVIQPENQNWELEQSGRNATLTISEWGGQFEFSNVFRRIPRTRLLSLSQEVTPLGVELRMSLACNCTVTADLMGGLLVLDIEDERSIPPSASNKTDENPVEGPAEEFNVVNDENANIEDISETVKDTAPTGPARDDSTLADSLEPDAPELPQDDALSQWLAQRLETAAERGFVKLNEDTNVDSPQLVTNMDSETAAQSPNADLLSSQHTDNAGQQGLEQVPEVVLQPAFEQVDELENLTEQLENSLSAALEDGLRQSLRVTVPAGTTSKAAPTSAEQEGEKENSSSSKNCIADHFLFAPDWIGKGSVARQITTLRGEFLQEFDKPNKDTARKLALLYLANGMGLEAIAVINELQDSFDGAELYKEIAEVVEGMPFRKDGILQAAAGCPGRSALWRTIAVSESEEQPILDADQLITDFSELPLELRRVLGPRLATSLLNRNQLEIARRVFSIVDRAAGIHGDEHELMRARIFEIDGRFAEAKNIYARLIVSNSLVATEAMVLLVAGILDRGEKVDADLLEQLETEAFRNRDLESGTKLRVLEIKARAKNTSLDSALGVVQDMIDQYPMRSAYFISTAGALLKAEDYNGEPIQDYVRAVYNHWDIATSPGVGTKVHESVSRQLLNAGLPNGALLYLEATRTASLPTPVEIQIQALQAVGRARDAFESVVASGLADDQKKTSLAIKALVRQDRHGEAYDLARNSEMPVVELADYGWRAGNWRDARQSSDETIAELSREMFVRSQKNDPEAAAKSTRLLPQKTNVPTIEETKATLESSTSIRNAIERAIANVEG